MWSSQVKGIPFLVFDVGGVLEMFDQATNQAAVIADPSIKALHGKLKSASLSQHSPPLCAIVRWGCRVGGGGRSVVVHLGYLTHV